VRHEAATQVGFVELVEVVRVEELVLKNKMKFWMFLKEYCWLQLEGHLFGSNVNWIFHWLMTLTSIVHYLIHLTPYL
jgi:hypothetical protein